MTSESAVRAAASSRTQPVVDGLLAAVRKTAHALESEAVAATALERAYREANSATAEVKNATRAEAAARVEIAQAKRGERQPLRDAEKAKEVAAAADQRSERRVAKWKAEEARLVEAEKRGKSNDRQWADKAKLKADEAGRQAGSAHAAAERAQEALAAACRETTAAEERARQAASRLRSARIADAKARRDAEKADETARLSIDEARTALQAEASAKSTVDRAIRTLKAAMLSEARAAEAGTSARPAKPAEVPVTRTGATGTVGQVTKKLKGVVVRSIRRRHPVRVVRVPAAVPVSVVPATAERRTVPARDGRTDLYKGTVRLLVTDPADHKDLSRLREGLKHVAGLRVTSVGGYSGEGATITVVADRPLPLALQISELDVVEKASKKDSDIEVRLRLPTA